MGKGVDPRSISLNIDLAEAIRSWRSRTGYSLRDLAEMARIGVGQALLASKGSQVPAAVEKRIREELGRGSETLRNDTPVGDLLW